MGTWEFIAQDVTIVYNPDNLTIGVGNKKKPLFKTLVIQKVGKHNIQYHISYDGRGGDTYRLLNDTTLFTRNYLDSTLIFYNEKNKTLRFSETKNDFIGLREHYLPEYKRIRYDEIIQHATEDNFFDFDISHYQSGNLKDGLPGEWLLPFRISPSFIKKKRIQLLELDIQSIEPRGVLLDTLHKKAKIEFNAGGHITKVTVIYENGREVYWSFIRRDDAFSSLAAIERFAPDTVRRKEGLREKETHYYDEDEWPVNHYGEKVVYPIEWKMYDSHLPLMWLDKHFKVGGEFLYDGQRLTRMFTLQNEERVIPISFVYDKDGVLTKVVWFYGKVDK
jgi:hypothetical protein